jgi:hypothetical protein
VRREVQDGARSEDEALRRLERAACWGWTAMAPARPRLWVIDVGTRTLAMAQRVGHQVAPGVAPGCGSLVWTDGLKA